MNQNKPVINEYIKRKRICGTLLHKRPTIMQLMKLGNRQKVKGVLSRAEALYIKAYLRLYTVKGGKSSQIHSLLENLEEVLVKTANKYDLSNYKLSREIAVNLLRGHKNYLEAYDSGDETLMIGIISSTKKMLSLMRPSKQENENIQIIKQIVYSKKKPEQILSELIDITSLAAKHVLLNLDTLKVSNL